MLCEVKKVRSDCVFHLVLLLSSSCPWLLTFLTPVVQLTVLPLLFPPACLRRMSLEVMTILCRCEHIETSEGVPLDVTGVAQVMH